ncbi:MAG: hypothetical protein ACT4PT_11120 [Methanobacteriota archaeon]
MDQREFLASVPRRFAATQAREADAYNRIIYALGPEYVAADLPRVLSFRGVGLPKGFEADRNSVHELNRAFHEIEYPDVYRLGAFVGVPGLTLEHLSTVLHFRHPAFPIWSREAVRAVDALQFGVRYESAATSRALDAYRDFIRAVDVLKDRIQYPHVPESNVFLTRLVEAALYDAGLQQS